MINAAIMTLIQAMPKGADPSVPRLVDLDPVMAGGPPFRRLFLDAMVVEESRGLERKFHSVDKYDANPVFTKEKPWDGWGPSMGTVFRDGDKLRMYYYCCGGKGGVVESEDGLQWTRPIVGEFEFEGSKQNNIVKCCHQVIKLANPSSPDRAYVSCHNEGLAWSPDGLHWTEQEKKHLFGSSDAQCYFFDPYNNRITCTWKGANRRHRSCGVVWSEDFETWTKPYDGSVFTADDLDPDATQIYAMPCFAYQGMHIGLPAMYRARWMKYGHYSSPKDMFEAQEGSPRTMDVELSWTWDFINWTRTPDRKPFIPNTPYHALDSGLIFSAPPVRMGDELWFYYSGWDQAHEDYAGVDCVICLAKLRLDGFCSMRGGDEPGWLISRREVFNTPRVIINAKVRPGGYIAAELLDRHNHVIPGFEWYYSNAFTGDSVRGELTWAKHPTFERPDLNAKGTWHNYPHFPDGLTDKDKKIKFYIKNADLYSYLPVDINTTIDDGWPD
jgi:hypothetical protein